MSGSGAQLRWPGLFVTATDTEVGKTVVTCAIAAVLRRGGVPGVPGVRVGVCKPIATGCRHDREGLVSEDAEALAHFADCRLPLATINPVRYREALAPAVAAERSGVPVDDEAIADSLRQLDASHDLILVEGVGGVMVPLDERRTVLDLARAIGYPVVVVARSTLGTLNHTAMTCRLIRDAGLTLAGIVINRYDADSGDIAEATNAAWLARQNGAPILATIPAADGVAPQRARMPESILDAVAMTDWRAIARRAKAVD